MGSRDRVGSCFSGPIFAAVGVVAGEMNGSGEFLPLWFGSIFFRINCIISKMRMLLSSCAALICATQRGAGEKVVSAGTSLLGRGRTGLPHHSRLLLRQGKNFHSRKVCASITAMLRISLDITRTDDIPLLVHNPTPTTLNSQTAHSPPAPFPPHTDPPTPSSPSPTSPSTSPPTPHAHAHAPPPPHSPHAHSPPPRARYGSSRTRRRA